MKIAKKITLLLLVFGILFGIYYAYSRLPIITGYAAKDMCSCIFIGDREEDDVLSQEFQFSLIKYATVSIDQENKTVTASVMGMGDKTAYYDAQKGCAILNNASKDNFLKDVNYASSIQNRTLPENLDDPTIHYEQLNKVIDAHFEDSDPEKPFGTRTVIVLKNGEIIAEKYANGFDKDSRQIGWSMTKSIFNALIGIAVKQDYIGSIDEKKLFKEWKKDGRKDITIKHLLQMNSGLEWTEDYGTISEATVMLYDKDNMVSFAKQNEFEAKIGEHWEYSSGSSNLLSGLLRQRFENYEAYFKFPYEQLFSKIGAPSFIIETDPTGNFVASSYAWATARDWAKFGQLFLDKGIVNGEALFLKDWTAFTSESANGSKGQYGAQFWLPTQEEYPNSPKDMYFADGFQGQRIFIIPSHSIVIVRLGLTRFEQPNYDALVSGVIDAID